VTVIGVADERVELLPPEARDALGNAEVVVGGSRHLSLWQRWGATGAFGPAAPELITVGVDADEIARAVHRLAFDARRAVCVLASGDPGFFGITRALNRSIDRRRLRIIPAPSAVSVAFGRLGLPWDDATVVSAHGRHLPDAVAAIRAASKVGVLTSPECPPEAIAKALLDAGCTADLVAVCSRLGTATERVEELSLPQVASTHHDPLSVLVLVGPGGLPLCGWSPAALQGHGLRAPQSSPIEPGTRQDAGRMLAWTARGPIEERREPALDPQRVGRSDAAYAHRGGMITKPEVRAVVVAKLDLPATGVLWDVGAGSGSVAIECALAQPGLCVLAIEQHADDIARLAQNARSAGVRIHAITGHAPEVLADLPTPDRVFVGGGGLGVLDAVLERVQEGGRVAATFAAIDRALAAADRLGNLVQLSVDHGRRLPDGSWRLEAANPVFLAWGSR